MATFQNLYFYENLCSDSHSVSKNSSITSNYEILCKSSKYADLLSENKTFSTLNEKINVYIEIEQNSNIKYEFNKNTNKLEVDRILPEPFVYPYSYGYIPNTLAEDGDDLDILIISNKEILNDNFYDVFIIGVLLMEDEKGMDEKILCVLEEDYLNINDISDLDIESKNKIYYFFENYKKKTPGKWSKVIGYKNKEYAIQLYKKSIVIEKM
jgi:inorganic pyrophosphatase